MSDFRVTVKSDRAEVEYTIRNTDHDHRPVHAAELALDTFAKHGHSKFPYNDGDLIVTVKEVPHDH